MEEKKMSEENLDVLVVEDIFDEQNMERWPEIRESLEKLRTVSDELDMNLDIAANYGQFESLAGRDYDFYVVDGRFPIDPNKADRALYESSRDSDVESEIEARLRERGWDTDCNPLHFDNLVPFEERSEDFYAGVTAIKQLRQQGKRYLLFTDGPGHGRTAIYTGLANGLLDIDKLVENMDALDASTPRELIQGQDVSDRSVVFGRLILPGGRHGPRTKEKHESYPYLIQEISKLGYSWGK